VSVREATAADLPTIRAIAHATWPVAYATILSPAQLAYMLEQMYNVGTLTEQLTHKGHRFLLAEGPEGPVGFAGFETGHALGRTRLHKLYVLPDVKGTGLGRQLLDAVCSEAIKAGDHLLELNVNKYNPAKGFYLRRGFHIERDEVIDIGQGHVMDDHVMVRTLP
jgi:GNAT superfamily N-acetyltransferase